MDEPLEIQEDVDLAPLTTFKVGGKARFFTEVVEKGQAIAALKFAHDRSVPVFVLGGGSNVLIADRGFHGLVIKIAILGIERTDHPDGTVNLSVGAGEDWDRLVKYCVDHGLAGIECLSGIPGSVGGTPVQNVGAYGQEVSESIISVTCLDRQTYEVRTVENAECGFAYRTSIFNTTAKDQFVVLAVNFRLAPGGAAKVEYKELLERFGNLEPSLSDVRAEVLKIRRSKSMVVDEDDPNSRGAGSFFKNPIVSLAEYQRLESRFGNVPSFPVATNNVKIPAAWLIENAGIKKGFVFRQAGVSANHTLAIVNRGHATARDVLDLKMLIQEAVSDKYGIELQPEPLFIGFP